LEFKRCNTNFSSFAQEQIPIPAIGAVTSGGGPGVAATLAGSAISTLLAAANPCAKLQKADEIIAQLGTGADSVAAAIGLVAAEQNFNPFVVSIPSICSDPSLPATEILRGIVPLIDPAVGGSDLENANSATSKKTPFDATGLSVADVMAAHGFTNFTTKALDGTTGTAPSGGAAPVAISSSEAAPAATSVAAVAPVDAAAVSCGPATVTVTAAAAAATTLVTAVSSAAAASSSAAAPATGAATASSLGLDFGTCVPTLKFEAGLDGRKETEFTFQAIDPQCNKGQEEALNPEIIMNRICDQLINVCGAADDAHTACKTAQAALGGGPRDVTTADAWNTQLGFKGTNTNPDNAPQPGLVGHT
jgi:hypothetical protein